MIEVSVSDLKRHLSKYIRRAKAGERFLIMRRAQPVVVLSGITRRLDAPVA